MSSRHGHATRDLIEAWLADTTDIRGHRIEHWRGPDYQDGYEAALERCAEELRDALGGATAYEPCVLGGDGRCTRWTHSHEEMA